jgi:hypothetical protein
MQLPNWVNANSTSLILIALLTTGFYPLARGWIAASGTALRPMLIWAFLSVGLSLVAQVYGLGESLDSGKPVLGRLTYLSTITGLAALLSALNARTPGGGAWALLMAFLVLVLLIPWLEEPGRFRQARGLRVLRLDAPWTIFFLLVAVTGITNYLLTRYGPSAILLGIGELLEYLSLTRDGWSSDARLAAWSGYSWCMVAAIWIAYRRRRSLRGSIALDRSWFVFRDHWGVVWGLRIAERFNKSAESLRWPCRLRWFGMSILINHEPYEIPEAATTTFRGLLRRFITPDRLKELSND